MSFRSEKQRRYLWAKEPKITKEPWSNKSGYSEAVEITPPDKTESQTIDLKGKFKAIRKDKKPLKETWF